MNLANANALVVQSEYKFWYDKHAMVVMVEEGDLVLLFLPLIGKLLQPKYCGPYVVLQRLGPVHYLVGTPDRRKTITVVHANLIRTYVKRKVDCLMLTVDDAETSEVLDDTWQMSEVHKSSVFEFESSDVLTLIQNDELK